MRLFLMSIFLLILLEGKKLGLNSKLVVFILVSILALLPSMAHADNNWSMTVNSVSGDPGSSVEAVISINNTLNMEGLYFEFSYNTDIFEEVQENDIVVTQEFSKVNHKDIDTTEHGRINFSFIMIGMSGSSEKVDVAKINLRVKQNVFSGSYDYFVDKINIADNSEYNKNLKLTTQKGTITIINGQLPATPTPIPTPAPSTSTGGGANNRVTTGTNAVTSNSLSELINNSKNALVQAIALGNANIIKTETLNIIEKSIQDASLVEVKNVTDEIDKTVFKVLGDELEKSLENVSLLVAGIESSIESLDIKDRLNKSILIKTPISGKKEKTIVLPTKQFADLFIKGINKVVIDTGDAKVVLDERIISEIDIGASKEISLTISKSTTDNEISHSFYLSSDNNEVAGLKYEGSFKYAKLPDEDGEKLILFYQTEDGNLQALNNCYYDDEKGYYTFSASKFGKFILKSTDVTFNDIDNVKWAANYIEGLAGRKIISGTGNNAFSPNSNVTREQFAKMLIEAFGLFDEASTTTLSDVDKDAWFYKYVATAERLGIVKGIGDNKFGIGSNISRQDMAVMALRAAEIAGKRIKVVKQAEAFKDEARILDYAKESVEYMQRANIINGIAEGEFAPIANATRAQAAKIVYLLYAQQ